MIAKVNQLIGSSPHSFEDAARQVLARANRSLRGITGIQLVDKRVKIVDDQVREYRVRLRLHFEIAPESTLHW